MKTTAKITCPYCNTAQDYAIDLSNGIPARPDVVCCDIDVGGCEKNFVVYPRILVSAKVSPIGSEAQEQLLKVLKKAHAYLAHHPNGDTRDNCEVAEFEAVIAMVEGAAA